MEPDRDRMRRLIEPVHDRAVAFAREGRTDDAPRIVVARIARGAAGTVAGLCAVGLTAAHLMSDDASTDASMLLPSLVAVVAVLALVASAAATAFAERLIEAQLAETVRRARAVERVTAALGLAGLSAMLAYIIANAYPWWATLERPESLRRIDFVAATRVETVTSIAAVAIAFAIGVGPRRWPRVLCHGAMVLGLLGLGAVACSYGIVREQRQLDTFLYAAARYAVPPDLLGLVPLSGGVVALVLGLAGAHARRFAREEVALATWQPRVDVTDRIASQTAALWLARAVSGAAALAFASYLVLVSLGPLGLENPKAMLDDSLFVVGSAILVPLAVRELVLRVAPRWRLEPTAALERWSLGLALAGTTATIAGLGLIGDWTDGWFFAAYDASRNFWPTAPRVLLGTAIAGAGCVVFAALIARCPEGAVTRLLERAAVIPVALAAGVLARIHGPGVELFRPLDPATRFALAVQGLAIVVGFASLALRRRRRERERLGG